MKRLAILILLITAANCAPQAPSQAPESEPDIGEDLLAPAPVVPAKGSKPPPQQPSPEPPTSSEAKEQTKPEGEDDLTKIAPKSETPPTSPTAPAPVAQPPPIGDEVPYEPPPMGTSGDEDYDVPTRCKTFWDFESDEGLSSRKQEAVNKSTACKEYFAAIDSAKRSGDGAKCPDVMVGVQCENDMGRFYMEANEECRGKVLACMDPTPRASSLVDRQHVCRPVELARQTRKFILLNRSVECTTTVNEYLEGTDATTCDDPAHFTEFKEWREIVNQAANASQSCSQWLQQKAEAAEAGDRSLCPILELGYECDDDLQATYRIANAACRGEFDRSDCYQSPKELAIEYGFTSPNSVCYDVLIQEDARYVEKVLIAWGCENVVNHTAADVDADSSQTETDPSDIDTRDADENAQPKDADVSQAGGPAPGEDDRSEGKHSSSVNYLMIFLGIALGSLLVYGLYAYCKPKPAVGLGYSQLDMPTRRQTTGPEYL